MCIISGITRDYQMIIITTRWEFKHKYPRLNVPPIESMSDATAWSAPAFRVILILHDFCQASITFLVQKQE